MTRQNIKKTLVAVSSALVFVFCLFTTNVSEHSAFNLGVAEAKSWSKWSRDLGKDIRRDAQNETRRTIRREIRDWERTQRRKYEDYREEQRNISRANGDKRFADHYLTDNEKRAYDTLMTLPVGKETVLYLRKAHITSIKKMCRELPEFAFVREAYDEYGNRVGAVIFRHA